MIYTEKENIRVITAVIIKEKNIKVTTDTVDMEIVKNTAYMENGQENNIYL